MSDAVDDAILIMIGHAASVGLLFVIVETESFQ